MRRNPLASKPGPEHATCETCVWRFVGGRGRPVERCRRHADARLDPEWPACAAYTPELDCRTCAACCREAYHTVEIAPRDPFVRLHPELCTQVDGRINLVRPGGVCAALTERNGRWTCGVYDDRPRSCREFEPAGGNCLEARRRLALTH